MNFWALGRILPDVVRTCAPMLALHVPARLLNGTGFWLKDAGVWREIHAVLSCLQGNAFFFASKDIHLCAKLAQEGCGSPLSHPLLLSRVAFHLTWCLSCKGRQGLQNLLGLGLFDGIKKNQPKSPGRILIYLRQLRITWRWWGSRSFVSCCCWAPLTARVFFLTSLVNYHLEKEPRCVHMSMECSF